MLLNSDAAKKAKGEKFQMVLVLGLVDSVTTPAL
jgi:hypothetical protein